MPYLELERLEAYYAINPEKIPEYIYVGWVYIPTGITSGHLYSLDRASKDVNRLLSKFDYQVQELANGYLLKAK